MYFSVDNIHQKCSEEDATYVKVQEKFVPVFKVEKKETEFVESQEFNEDNYICDIGNSFSSENQTVIEKNDSDVTEPLEKTVTPDTTVKCAESLDRYEGMDLIDDVNKTLESAEGEYHSFTDLEESYESPVKELVEKDIRDYSVPIDFYCEDYKAREEAKKSPLKVKNILEPILEESKSSYDESNASNNERKDDIMDNLVGEVVDTAVLASQLKLEIATTNACKVTTESLVAECVNRQECYMINEEGSAINDIEINNNGVQTAIFVYENAKEQEMIDSVYENVFEILSTDNESEYNTVKRQNSLASTLSSNDRFSFDSTAEFEKYEAVSDIITVILNKIDYLDIVLPIKDIFLPAVQERDTERESPITQEIFSIAKIIEDIEMNVCLNETVLTDASETDISLPYKVIEGIVYYIFDRAMFINNEKVKGSKKTAKRVITVADFEDILYTAKPIFDLDVEVNIYEKINQELLEEKYQEEYQQEVLETSVNVVEECINQVTELLEYDHDLIKKRTEVEKLKEGNLCQDIILYDGSQINATVLLERLAESREKKELVETFLNETFLESSDMNNAFHEDFSQSEDPTISSHIEDLFVTPDDHLSLENREPERTTSLDEGFVQDHNTTYDQIKTLPNIPEEQDVSTVCKEESIESSNEQIIFSPEYRDITTRDLDNEYYTVNEGSQTRKVRDALSRSSSPNRQPIFELTDSPIKNATSRRVLRDTDITSPFIKKANVISMSQTEHSGGVKYWLSFDENLSVENEKPAIRNVKSIDDTLPSFISIDLDDEIDNKSNELYEKETNMNTKRSSVLLSDYVDNEVSFPSPSTSNIEFATCESRIESKHDNRDYEKLETVCENSEAVPQRRLLYELHSHPSKRLYSSWPPFEDTLFYQIISKFRMSESFDPSDLDMTKFDEVE